jgi:probable F420-dependent oxidoreductase
MVRYGAVFPQNEIGSDPGAVRDFAQAAEDLGYDYLLAYDHVLGADPAGRDDFTPGRYTHEDMFHEPFTLFAYLAALTERIELATGVLVLPQRQTALVAKQAAEVDVLSGGRLILGVGSGWNYVEYESLGEDFRTRGRRLEEQVGLLRRLWAEPIVDFEGEFHRVPRAGLNPLPGREIPIWMGGGAPAVLDRIGRIGDGWYSTQGKPDLLERDIAAIHESARNAGRDPSEIGIGVMITQKGDPEAQAAYTARVEAVGCTDAGLVTMGGGFATPDEHIVALRAYKEAVS